MPFSGELGTGENTRLNSILGSYILLKPVRFPARQSSGPFDSLRIRLLLLELLVQLQSLVLPLPALLVQVLLVQVLQVVELRLLPLVLQPSRFDLPNVDDAILGHGSHLAVIR